MPIWHRPSCEQPSYISRDWAQWPCAPNVGPLTTARGAVSLPFRQCSANYSSMGSRPARTRPQLSDIRWAFPALQIGIGPRKSHGEHGGGGPDIAGRDASDLAAGFAVTSCKLECWHGYRGRRNGGFTNCSAGRLQCNCRPEPPSSRGGGRDATSARKIFGTSRFGAGFIGCIAPGSPIASYLVRRSRAA